MRLHVMRWGPAAGAPVVCLHGVMGTALRFRRFAETWLADRPVWAFDLRGHGASGWDPPWNLEVFLNDVRESLDAEGIGRADIVGFSFGGRLALELAGTDPGRVRRLALLDPAVQMAPEVAAAFAEDARRDVSFAEPGEAVDLRMSGLAHADRTVVAQDVEPVLVRGDDGRLRYPVRLSAVIAAYGEMARAPRLPSGHPTLLVRASDGIVDDRQERLLAEALADRLTVVRVPGSHSVMWDAAEETGRSVAQHLKGGPQEV